MSERALGRGGLSVGPYAFGMAPLANLGRVVNQDDVDAALNAAWDAGIRYFDTAPHYGVGLGEERLGAFLRTKPREEFVLSTKVGRLLVEGDGQGDGQGRGTREDDQGFAVQTSLVRQLDYTRDGVLRSIEESLVRLGLDSIDIVFVHDPDNDDRELHYRQSLEGGFPALDELRSQGVISSYGAGMNQTDMLTDFVRNTDLDVVMIAGRYSLLEQGALDDLLPAALERDVSVVAAAVFNSGLLARDRPTAGATYNYEPAPQELIDRVNRLADVCDSHGVSLPVAAVQFALGHPAVATVCVGARSAEQVERNVALFDADIPGALWSDLVDAGLLRADAPLPS
jgi:D-threo-aldose 1-dehydrogenase